MSDDEPAHMIISDLVIKEYFYQNSKNKYANLGGFFATIFIEFWKSIGDDRNYILLRETEYKRLIEKVNMISR